MLDPVHLRVPNSPSRNSASATELITALASLALRFNTHSDSPRPPQPPAASFKRLYRK